MDAVASLPQADVPVAASKTGFAGVRAMNARRRAAHDEAEAQWDRDRKSYYAMVEDRALEAGRALRTDLAALDGRIAARLEDCSKREVLVDMQLQDVHSVLDRIMRMHADREARLGAFEGFLDSVESARASELGTRLKQFVKEAADIGHKLVSDIERWVEGETHDINMLVVRNRKDAAVTVAALRAAGVKARSGSKARWRREVLAAWRSTKHEAALQRAVTQLSSDASINPPARAAAVSDLRRQTEQRHTELRLPLLEQLLSLRPSVLSTPSTDAVHAGPTLDRAKDFSAAAVAGVHEALTELSVAEQTEQAAGFERVQAASTLSLAAADADVQELRWELHHYAALAPPADVPAATRAVQAVVDDASLEGIFKRGGGLKGELSALVAEAESRAVTVNGACTDMQARAEVLISAAPLGDLMQEAGRAATRSAALETIDNLRTARRGAVPALLGSLIAQLARVSSTPGLSEALQRSLQEVQEGLLEIAQEVAAAMGAAGMPVPDVLASALGSGAGGVDGGDMGTVARGTTAGSTAMRSGLSVKFNTAGTTPGASSRAGTSRGGAGSVSGRTARSGMASQMTDRVSAALASALPIAELRRAGRRAGMLLSFTELPPAATASLQGLVQALAAQRTANDAVDAAIAERVQPVLARRQAEAAGFLRRLGLALQGQSETLAEAADNLCQWMGELAAAVHTHVQREVQLDTVTGAALRHAQDDFRARGQALEAAMETHIQAVCSAGDDDALAQRNASALAQLDVIEAHYRDMHSAVTALASAHPRHTAMHARALRRELCSKFALSYPQAHTVDGVPAVSQGAAEAAADLHARGVWVTRMRHLVEDGVASLPEEEGAKGGKGGKKAPSKAAKGTKDAAAAVDASEDKQDDPLDQPADLDAVSDEEAAGLQWAYQQLGEQEGEGGDARRGLDAAVAAARAAVLQAALGAATFAKDALDWGPGNMDLEFGDPEELAAADEAAAMAAEQSIGQEGASLEGGPAVVQLTPLQVPQRALSRLVQPQVEQEAWSGEGGAYPPVPPLPTSRGAVEPVDEDDEVSQPHAAASSGAGGAAPRSQGAPHSDDGAGGAGCVSFSVRAPRPQLLLELVSDRLPAAAVATSAAGPTASAQEAPPSPEKGATVPGLPSLGASPRSQGGASVASDAGAGGLMLGLLPAVDEYVEACPLPHLAASMVAVPWRSETQAALLKAAAAAQEAAAAVRAGAAARKAEEEAAAASTKGGKGGKKSSGRKGAAAAAEEEAEAAAAAAAAKQAAAAVEEEAAAAAAAAAAAVPGAPSAAELEVYSQGVEDGDGTPLDPFGSPAMCRLHVPVLTVTSWLDALRMDILSLWAEQGMARVETSLFLQQRTHGEAGADMDDRLRKHWPRAGRLETRVRHVREAQLLEHEQLIRRQAATWNKKQAQLVDTWNTQHAQALAAARDAVGRLASLGAVLPDQEDMASLAAVQKRAKQLLAAAQDGGEAALTALSSHAAHTDASVDSSSNDFLRSCVPFSDGGNWAAEELERLQEALADRGGQVRAITGAWRDSLQVVEEALDEVDEAFGQFAAEYEHAAHDLSLREGLGVKFGAPRRVGQEKIRTAFSWCSEDEQAIKARLDELDALLREMPGSHPGTPPSPCVGGEEEDVLRVATVPRGAQQREDGSVQWEVSTAPAPLSLRIRRVLAWLRSALAARGHFLAAYKPDVRPLPPGTAVPFDEPPPVALLPPTLLRAILDRAPVAEGIAVGDVAPAGGVKGGKNASRTGSPRAPAAELSPTQLQWLLGLLGESFFALQEGDAASKGHHALGLPAPEMQATEAIRLLRAYVHKTGVSAEHVEGVLAAVVASGVLQGGQVGPSAMAATAPAPPLPGVLPPSLSGESSNGAEGTVDTELPAPHAAYPSWSALPALHSALAAASRGGTLPLQAVQQAVGAATASLARQSTWGAQPAAYQWPLIQDTLAQAARIAGGGVNASGGPSISRSASPKSASRGKAPSAEPAPTPTNGPMELPAVFGEGLRSTEEALAAALGLLHPGHPGYGVYPCADVVQANALSRPGSAGGSSEGGGGEESDGDEGGVDSSRPPSAGASTSVGSAGRSAMVKGNGVGETEAFGAAATFVDTVRAALDGVKADTRALFAAEGCPLEAGDEELPESLLHFCETQMARVTEDRVRQLKVFRDQVLRTHELLGAASAVVVQDTAQRALQQASAADRAAAKRTGRLLDVLEEARGAHERRLVPQLADPNRREELLALVSAEAERSAEKKILLWRARREELSARRRVASSFVRRLLYVVAATARDTDGLVLPVDLEVIPGEEQLLVVHPSLHASSDVGSGEEGSAKTSPRSAASTSTKRSGGAASAGTKGGKGGSAAPEAATFGDTAAELVQFEGEGASAGVALSSAGAGIAGGVVADDADARGGDRISLKRLRKRLARKEKEEAAEAAQQLAEGVQGGGGSTPKGGSKPSKSLKAGGQGSAAALQAPVAAFHPEGATWMPTLPGCAVTADGVPSDSLRQKHWRGVQHPAAVFGISDPTAAMPAWVLLVARALAIEGAAAWIDSQGGVQAVLAAFGDAASAVETVLAAALGESSGVRGAKGGKKSASSRSTPRGSAGKGASKRSPRSEGPPAADSSPPPLIDVGSGFVHEAMVQRLLQGASADDAAALLANVAAACEAILGGRIPQGDGLEGPPVESGGTKSKGGSRKSTPRKGSKGGDAASSISMGSEAGEEDSGDAEMDLSAATLMQADPFQSARGERFLFPDMLVLAGTRHVRAQAAVLRAVYVALPPVGGFVSVYSSCTRHAIEARDAQYAAYGAAHQSAVAAIEARYLAEWEGACQWDRRWAGLTKALYYHTQRQMLPRNTPSTVTVQQLEEGADAQGSAGGVDAGEAASGAPGQ